MAVLACSLCERCVCIACAPGWIKYGRRCYEFVASDRLTFNAAARICRSRRAQLLAITSQREGHWPSHYVVVDL